MQEVLWRPDENFINNSNLKDYENWLARNYNIYFDSYSSIWEWSVNNVEAFWESIWNYFKIIDHGAYDKVLSGSKMPEYEWFKGSRINYAEHIFRQKSDTRHALLFYNEEAEVIRISWEELENKVAAVRKFLIEKGIAKGDCVVGFLPNIPETLYIFLAVNSLGAIWSCCSPDFGVNTITERFSQIHPKVLFAVDGYQYNGKPYNKLSIVEEIGTQISSIEETIIIPYLDKSNNYDGSWQNIISDLDLPELAFEAVPFDHPIWVLYSSGTTGKPKAITHSHGGVLLEHLKYMAFHNDVHEGENFFWFSTTGWMMWNFLQASLLMGASPVLFDGSPSRPDLNLLWELTEKMPIHHFGTSAPYLIACMKQGLTPGKDYDLSQLRSIGSTGAPLPPEAFMWVYQNISPQVWLCSMSGGTDVCTAFVGGCPYEPVYTGAIQCRALGSSLKAYDDSGNEVIDQLGEMIIDQPMPSMPVFFWNDEGKKRYLASYFDTYPGIWRHGDWIHIKENGSLIIHGRSDATLNRKGIRIGTAEIYNVLDGIEEVKDAMILNLEQGDGEDIMPLFVMLEKSNSLNEELKSKINKELKSHCSPRHVPDIIIEVPDIPYTLSGKKMEVPVKKILMGMTTKENMNKEAIRNPKAMDFFLEINF
jgi:acetoacetyl-CoA synthetase